MHSLPEFLHLLNFVLQLPLFLFIFTLFLLDLALCLQKLVGNCLLPVLYGLVFLESAEELSAKVEEFLLGFDDSMRHLSDFQHRFVLAVSGGVQGFALLFAD